MAKRLFRIYGTVDVEAEDQDEALEIFNSDDFVTGEVIDFGPVDGEEEDGV